MASAIFRRYFVDDPAMVFADGVAAGETINVLDQGGGSSGGRLRTLGAGAAVGAVLAFVRDGLGWVGIWGYAMRFKVGMEWSVLSLGTGMLIGLNVGLSMLAGTIVVWLFGPMVMETAGTAIIQNSIAPQYIDRAMAMAHAARLDPVQQTFLNEHGGLMNDFIAGEHFPIVMLWFMWPATSMMITAALTAVLLKWRSIVKVFTGLSVNQQAGEIRTDVSIKSVAFLSLLLTLLLAHVQFIQFHVPYWQTIAAVICGLPLILVGVRVLGETNSGPVSLMANTLQAIFRLFSPSIAHNLVAAGMAGNINSQGEGLMQVYKTGKMVGSTPRILTWVQFWAIPIGAAAVAIMYPLLVTRYGLGGNGLAAPTGLKLANMAVLMSKGISAFPPGALLWTVIAGIAGVAMTLLKDKLNWTGIPSAAGFGFALILPGTLNIPVALGAVMAWAWDRANPKSSADNCVTLASGFIGGEALVAGLILPVLFYFGIM
jgi:uncharacterized oligopeptide transporter (OPT) family protein